MSLPCYRWTLSPLPSRENVNVPRMLSQWHRATKLGARIQSLEILQAYSIEQACKKTIVDSDSLERLNLWLSANGAWTCSLLPHFEADRVLGRILRQGGAVRIGTTSGGRWPAGTTTEEILGDGCQCIQGELRF